ncbi:hypothetical protein N7495_009361 [Penicillium taxi]|uniref:uncharacterized protein n=1 Tax=Penicillium taxi TaxID=168475 RepID=UPI0025456487|nr:uncharacterized protein N7495_009361 [Penicillium taxi]KAJ5884851.1 hypothetical protein N7495_009361 [Penicillium taxi]
MSNLIFITILSTLAGSLLFYYLHLTISERIMNNFQAQKVWNLENEVIIVTGGSRGIGKQIVEDLALLKARVLILDIKSPTFELPKNAVFYQADITSAKSIAEVALLIRESYGNPAVLVNNAGVFQHGTILEKSEQEIRQTFEVNTIAHFLLLKEFLPSMIQKNRGHIVTVASVASFVAVGEMVDYCCSKASALTFHEGLKQELKYWYNAPNVRTSIIHPLWVDTPMIKGFTDYQSVFGQPVMSPDLVSQKVVEQIISGKSGNIILPKMISVSSSLKALPLWMQEVVRSFVSSIVYQVAKVRSVDSKAFVT